MTFGHEFFRHSREAVDFMARKMVTYKTRIKFTRENVAVNDLTIVVGKGKQMGCQVVLSRIFCRSIDMEILSVSFLFVM